MRRTPESKLVHRAADFASWSVPPSAFVQSKLIIAGSAKLSLGVLNLSWLGGLSLFAAGVTCGITGPLTPSAQFGKCWDPTILRSFALAVRDGSKTKGE
jgi:hypothetical protein